MRKVSFDRLEKRLNRIYGLQAYTVGLLVFLYGINNLSAYKIILAGGFDDFDIIFDSIIAGAGFLVMVVYTYFLWIKKDAFRESSV